MVVSRRRAICDYEFVVCVNDADFGDFSAADLVVGKCYEVLARAEGWLRIIDESGEDDLYPVSQVRPGRALPGSRLPIPARFGDGLKINSRRTIDMANLTIRKLEPATKERLRLRAARRGHSMEEEARRILSEACPPEPEAATAYACLRRYFVDLGGIDLAPPPRQPGRQPPEFD